MFGPVWGSWKDDSWKVMGRQSKIVIDALSITALAVHFLEYLRIFKPRVQLEAANPKGIIQILPGPGAEPIE